MSTVVGGVSTDRLHAVVQGRYVAIDRAWKLRRAERRVFVDCGANTCTILRRFLAKFPDFEFFAFEPQPELQDKADEVIREHPDRKITFAGKAVWTCDEQLQFFLAGSWTDNYRGGSTLVEGQTGNECQVDYAHPVQVEAFDFSRWLSSNFTERDYIVVKMDIEGAEYDVLEKMIEDNSLRLVNELYVEFHQHMNPTISKARHERLTDAIRRTTHLLAWH
jgi:FkbM family methyltransferase